MKIQTKKADKLFYILLRNKNEIKPIGFIQINQLKRDSMSFEFENIYYIQNCIRTNIDQAHSTQFNISFDNLHK